MKLIQGPRLFDVELPEDFRIVQVAIPALDEPFTYQLQEWIEYRVRLVWWHLRRVSVKGWRPVRTAHYGEGPEGLAEFAWHLQNARGGAR